MQSTSAISTPLADRAADLSRAARLSPGQIAADAHAAEAHAAPAGGALPITLALAAESALDAVQREMDALKAELNELRRRDETLNFYMQRIDEELRLAARLQKDFLPKELPQVGRVHFHSLFRPAGYVSGDLYDVMRLDERHVGFYMADAVGHGVPAALLTMFLKHAHQTKETLPSGPGAAPGGYALLDPGESLRRLNCLLLEQNLSQSTFATAVYGYVDVQTLEARIARAGHPQPILMRAGGGPVELLEPQGCLLGVLPDEQFDTCTVQLHPGDRLLLYTDGIEVAFWDDQAAHECPTRWLDEVLARRHMSAERLLLDFAEHIDRESGSLQAKDDLTMVLLDVEA